MKAKAWIEGVVPNRPGELFVHIKAVVKQTSLNRITFEAFEIEIPEAPKTSDAEPLNGVA